MAFIERRINVDATSYDAWCLYNVAITSMQRHNDATLYKHHVYAGL